MSLNKLYSLLEVSSILGISYSIISDEIMRFEQNLIGHIKKESGQYLIDSEGLEFLK